ncbi:hypothetical protein HNO88_003970 [Novosphingobium chloroacetimidivorans]|uniref:Uncharacterized protein n=1 Tax=Novosphingobium chloroacetimidivorans TaxID=1428314 RepID=A0A7W7KDX9_9SPHN|nr:hypothetical protein [Novosphingobium chloroacetimidivorans]MBB4860626.1 hypothetical protein [Novosphingobium chloroacetimidivorans]
MAEGGPAAGAELQFNLGAEALLECEAGAVWPFRGDAVPPGLLRMGARGKVETRAGLSLPFGQVGGGSAHAAARGEACLGFFFRPRDSDAPFAEALARTLTAMPEPLDLSQISHAMALADLEGLVLACDGAAEAGVSVVAGESFAIPSFLSGSAGLAAELSFRRNARWILSVRRHDNALHFVLSRDQLRERNWSAGLDLQLDISGLARRVHDLLVKADELAKPALSQIAPFLSPGTYLATQARPLLFTAAKSIVEHGALRRALLDDVSIALAGPADADSALVEHLATRISALAATQERALLSDLDVFAGTIVDGLVRSVPGLAAADLAEQVKARICPLLGDLQTRFTNAVQALAASVGPQLAAELAAVGTAVNKTETRADVLLAGTRELVDTFDSFSQQVIATTSDGVAKKLQARFGWSGADMSGAHYELIGTITDATEPVSQLWRALVTGRLQPFQLILADPSLAPAGLQLAPNSSLARFAGTQRGFALEAVVLGVDVSLASIVSGKARIDRTAAGDVTVTAEGSALRKVDGFDEGRSASFVSSWDLMLGKLDEVQGGGRTMSVAIAFDHEDQNLSAKEVNGFFAGLERQRLIDASRSRLALATYQQWRTRVESGKDVKGRIEVRMGLTAEAMQRMVRLGRAVNQEQAGVRLRLFALAGKAQLAAGVADAAGFERDCKRAREEFREIAGLDDPWQVMFALRKVDLTPESSTGTNRYGAFARMMPRALGFPDMLAKMADIYDAVPVGTGGSPGGWTEKDYAKAEKELAAHARKWLRLNQKFIFFFKDEMHPAMLAFLRLLADMNRALLPGDDPLAGLEQPADAALSNGLVTIVMVPQGGALIPV